MGEEARDSGADIRCLPEDALEGQGLGERDEVVAPTVEETNRGRGCVPGVQGRFQVRVDPVSGLGKQLSHLAGGARLRFAVGGRGEETKQLPVCSRQGPRQLILDLVVTRIPRHDPAFTGQGGQTPQGAGYARGILVTGTRWR